MRLLNIAEGALVAAALAVLYDIGPPDITHPALGCLYAAVMGYRCYQDWQSGRLRMTLGQIYRNPPRTSALQTLGFVLGSVAVWTIM